ncbi:MAG TPA: hypothetical protein VM097_00045 [Mycobacteriales bacterium]|nr:hypothetical protein [Mycobacteriales bacterium]
MTELPDLPEDVDSALAEHVIAIRNRFGLIGLKQAQHLIALEITIYEDSYANLDDSP